MTSRSTRPPTRRALLLAGNSEDLPGTAQDLEIMDSWLRRQGFEISSCHGQEADRNAFLRELQRLVATTQRDDAVLVYFSGHGGRCTFSHPDEHTRHDDETWRYIVPAGHPGPGRSFRAVLGVELSWYIYQIYQKTENVTVALDCCFAAPIVRGHGGTIKSDDRSVYPKPAFLSEVLRVIGKPDSILDPEAHDELVRLVASSAERPAWEIPVTGAGRHGLFTYELLNVVREPGSAKLPWDTILRRVRARVQTHTAYRQQMPHVIGPSGRVPFSMIELSTDERTSVVEQTDDCVVLDGGRLHGLSEGSAVRLADHESANAPQTARVISIGEDWAVARLAEAHTRLTPGSVAYHESHPVKLYVALDTPNYEEALASAIARSPRLELADSAKASVSIERTADSFRVHDKAGALYTAPRGQSAQRLIAWLDARARGAALHAVTRDPAGLFPPLTWSCRVRVLGCDDERSLAPHGDELAEGERVSFSIQNTSPRGTPYLYVNVLDIGVSGSAQLVSRSQPTGIELPPGRRYELGSRPGARPGIRVSWPAGVDRDRARRASFVFLVSTKPVDLRTMLTRARRASYPVDPSTRSPRSARPRPRPLPWDARHYQYHLHPTL